MRQRSLRRRLTFAVGLGAAFLSVLFASLAYFGVRHILVTESQNADLRQAYVNAALVRNSVVAGSPPLHSLVASLDTATSSMSLVDLRGVWVASSLAQPRSVVPLSMRVEAARQVVARQVVVRDGVPELVIDVPIPSINAVYYQLHNLRDLDQTLRRLLFIFAGGAALTTLIGVLGGRTIIRRAMAPLEVASFAARRVASGELDARIPEDPRNIEVATLATSFNSMLEQLVERLDRDARFAGDVSHELRSPLTTLATSVEVLRHSRDEMTPEGRAAFDLLAADVQTFQVLVEDLLEMARSDAGEGAMHLEVVGITELVHQCVRSAVRRHQLHDVPVRATEEVANLRVRVDRRRFERVISNLLENAERYGGGATAIRVALLDGDITLDVDDAGPGVSPEDRSRVFDRFYRGSVARDRGASRGTGLGLALVADHVRHFGGRIALLDSPESGARFRITLPIAPEVDS